MITNASLNYAQTHDTTPAIVGPGAESSGASTADLRRVDSSAGTGWIELIRDVVAVANSGGGSIRIDEDAGESRSVNLDQLATAAVVERLARYADSPFGDVSVHLSAADGGHFAEVVVGPAEFPISFRELSTTGSNEAEQQRGFAAGTFYFRHGERTLPGTSADLRVFFQRKLRHFRRRWLREIRRVLSSTDGSAGSARPAEEHVPPATNSMANLQPVRIVTDANAPALQPQHVDQLYPWRQKELVHELNTRLGRRTLTTYDVQAVRRQHRLDERPEFVFHLPGAGRRYSPAVADWIIDQLGSDPEFFQHARRADQAMLRLRRQKPR